MQPSVVVKDPREARHQAWVLDLQTGSTLPALFNSDKSCGFGLNIGDKFVALYTYNAHLYLRVDDKSWQLDGELAKIRICNRSWRQATYEIESGGVREIIRLRFPWSQRLHTLLSPTYDDIDSQSDDLLYYAAQSLSPFWASAVISRWTNGT